MKILIELRTAMNVENINSIPVSRGNIRKQQYISGLEKISKYYNEICNCDVILVDNTLNDLTELSSDIKSLLPKDCFFHIKNKNNYGKYNKGAGDIDMWNDYSNMIRSYEYFFHYEPRLQLIDFSFIRSFLKNPRNYFCLDETYKQVKTGYFGVDTIDFYEFYSQVNIDEMVKNSVSIELLMFNFFKNKSSEFIKDSFYSLWHDVYENEYRNY